LDRLDNRLILSKAAGDKYGDKLYENLVGTRAVQVRQLSTRGHLVFTRNDD
jgi:hypothetical protein